MIALISFVLVSVAASHAETIHPAFDITPADAEAAFQRGYTDADHARDDNGVLNRYRRGIGDVRTSPLKHETVSFLWVVPPVAGAYQAGFEARKKFEPDETIRAFKDTLRSGSTHPARHLWATGHIRLLPSRGGLYGSLSRRSNPKDLEDVRVVLKVGMHVYQPIRQPGDLLGDSGTGTNRFTTHETETTRTSGTVTSPRGNDYTVSAVQSSTFKVTHEQNFKWYDGDFHIPFDLFEPDGTPRITTEDKDFEIIVVYGSNERHAKYELADFLKI